jgi:hypothetical protein
MRIFDAETKLVLNGVLLMLTPEEASELWSKIKHMTPENGGHIHVNDAEYQREIIVAIYTKDNLHFFTKDIQKAIEEE